MPRRLKITFIRKLSLLLNVGTALFVTMYLVKLYKLHRLTQNKVSGFRVHKSCWDYKPNS